MCICSELTGPVDHCSSFPMFFLQIRAQGLATSPNPIFSKLITSLLGHCLLHCNCLRLGSAGANQLRLFCDVKAGFSLCTAQHWQVKADEAPGSEATVLLPRESSPKSKAKQQLEEARRKRL